MQYVFASTNRDLRTVRQLLPPQAGRRWMMMLCVLGVSALLTTVMARTAAADAEAFPTDAIGRLIIDGRRICTAFVVRSIPRRVSQQFGGSAVMYENWLATAGHCHGDRLIFQQGNRTHEMRVLGFSTAGADGFDVMLMSFVTDRRVPALEPAFGEYPQTGDLLMLIGYGSNALMMRVGPLLRFDERGHMEIHGYASRGSSGGPVLIPGTRRVVGIGIETTLDKPAGASFFYCVLASCAVKPPYVAAHIDRLKGIASFH